MSNRFPRWDVDGRDWSNRKASQFVEADRYRWHVQTMRQEGAPRCLLLHGTAAATHSWRDVMPLLAETFEVLALDLPGHGFTRSNFAQQVTLPGMSQSVAALLEAMDFQPDCIVGHSAGAAIGAQIILDAGKAIPLVGITPALLPFPGLAAKLFPSLAQLLFANPMVPVIFSRIARAPGQPQSFLERSTGSKIDVEGARTYRALLTKSGHCDGAIRMMANWRLEDLAARLPQFPAQALLVTASRDNAIPPDKVKEAASLFPHAELETVPDAGHLVHEEQPEKIAAMITAFYQRVAEERA